MKSQPHKNTSRPPPEESAGMISASQAACEQEKSFRELRKRLASKKNPSGSFASGLRARKVLLGASQAACEQEKSFRELRKRLASKKSPSGSFASGLRDRKNKSSVYFINNFQSTILNSYYYEHFCKASEQY